MLDGYSVCQRCFEQISGVDTWEGRTYCEECYKVVATPAPTQVVARPAPKKKKSPHKAARLKSYHRGEMSHSSGIPINRNLRGEYSEPKPAPAAPARPEREQSWPSPAAPPPQPSRSHSWIQCRVRHDDKLRTFSGRLIASCRHSGMSPLLPTENRRAGSVTLVEVFEAEQGFLIIAASSCAQSSVPYSSAAFKIGVAQLRRFLAKQSRSSPAWQQKAWCSLHISVAKSLGWPTMKQ